MRSRALLAYVGPKDRRVARRLEEFEALAEAAHMEHVGTITQYGEQDSRFYFGRGKLEEIASKDFDILITYHSLSPIQIYNLQKFLKREIMDRVLLILKIFDERASGLESKLQIELARLRYQLPMVKEYVRRAKMGEQIGFLGAGEYAIDAYYRHMVDRISAIRRRLDKIRENRVSLINKRKEAGVPEVVLTGYTSVGKTTLFNRLTRENKYVDGKPFATLDTYSRRINLWGKEVVLTDTIGFIEDLPPVLIESFYSTLEEVASADVVLLVMDASDDDEQFAMELETSIRTLSDIGIYKDKIIPILNKIDKAQNNEIINKSKIIRKYFNYFLPVSARLGVGIDVLKFFLFWRTPGYAIYEVRPPIGGLVLGDRSYLPVKAERAASIEAELSNLYMEIRRVA